MIQFFSKKLRNKKGFTLVELLLVIAILGIIAGVAVPRVLNANLSTKFKADQATANMAVSKVEAMILLGEITSDTDGWETLDTSTDGLNYQEAIPNCQSADAAFIIQINKADNLYTVTVVSGAELSAIPTAVATSFDDTTDTTVNVFAMGSAQPVDVN